MMGMTISKKPEGVKQPELNVVSNADGSATLTLPEGGGGGCSVA